MNGLGSFARLVALLILPVFLSLVQANAAQAAPGIKHVFDKTGEPNTNLKPFPKWTGALEKYFNEKRKSETNCTVCPLRDWQALIAENKTNDADRILKNINRELNRKDYITDIINWGVEDYWESPGEFYAKFGDCEDYAIAKYLTLRALGFTPDQLLVTAVQDMNLRVGHAILIVFLNGNTYVLDNQIKLIVEDRKVKHYKPIFAVNEEAWWRFK